MLRAFWIHRTSDTHISSQPCQRAEEDAKHAMLEVLENEKEQGMPL